jgi:hypothetical protein
MLLRTTAQHSGAPMLRELAERAKLRPHAFMLGWPMSDVPIFRFPFFYIILELNKNLNNFVFEQNSYTNKNLNLNKKI